MKNFLIILTILITPFVLFSQQKEDNYYIKKIIQESVEKADRERARQKAEVLPILFSISGIMILMGLSMIFAKKFWINSIKIGNRFKGVKTEITPHTYIGIYIGGIGLIVGGLWLIFFAQGL